jgi:hypothetical protein
VPATEGSVRLDLGAPGHMSLGQRLYEPHCGDNSKLGVLVEFRAGLCFGIPVSGAQGLLASEVQRAKVGCGGELDIREQRDQSFQGLG